MQSVHLTTVSRLIPRLSLFLLCFFSSFGNTIFAQKFPENTNEFVEELGKFMTLSKRPDMEESYAVFKKMREIDRYAQHECFVNWHHVEIARKFVPECVRVIEGAGVVNWTQVQKEQRMLQAHMLCLNLAAQVERRMRNVGLETLKDIEFRRTARAMVLPHTISRLTGGQ